MYPNHSRFIDTLLLMPPCLCFNMLLHHRPRVRISERGRRDYLDHRVINYHFIRVSPLYFRAGLVALGIWEKEKFLVYFPRMELIVQRYVSWRIWSGIGDSKRIFWSDKIIFRKLLLIVYFFLKLAITFQIFEIFEPVNFYWKDETFSYKVFFLNSMDHKRITSFVFFN